MPQSAAPSPWDRVTVVAGLHHSTAILPSFYEKMAAAKHIILSDGASTDDTVETARRLRPGTLVLTNDYDPGVPAIYNQCIRAATTDYVLQINPDAEISSDSIAGLVEILDSNPRAAGAAPLIIQGHAEKTYPEVDVMGPGEHLHQKAAPLPDGPMCTWFVTGAVVLWRRAAFDDFGFLDESFFFYGDDLDICLRATRAGWSLILDPACQARHVGAGSAGDFSRKARWRKAWCMAWGHLRTVDKYEGRDACRLEARRMLRENFATAVKYALLLNRKKLIPAAARVDATRKYLRGDPWWGEPLYPQTG